jgi:type I restriction enzyme M protein
LFFNKGFPTDEVWIYDLRTNIEKITKSHPITAEYFKDFENSYSRKPRKETDRFRRFKISDVKKRNYNLDIIWLKDESDNDSGYLNDPAELTSEAIVHLESALNSLNELAVKLNNEDHKA